MTGPDRLTCSQVDRMANVFRVRIQWAGFALLITGLFCLLSCATTRSQQADGIDESGFIPLGSVQINSTTHSMIISGKINQVEGLIELLACGPRGKTHESAFVLFAEAMDIQTGLLLIGLKHGDPMKELGQGPPVGDEVKLEIQWKQDGKMHRANVDNFLIDKKTGKTIKSGAWIFNGSVVADGFFQANAEESLIASYWDPWAIINIKSSIGSDDERVVIDRKSIPPLNTPIQLIIHAVNPGER